VGLRSGELVLLVENEVTAPHGEQLRPKLFELITNDPAELLLRRVEETAESSADHDPQSGLGFITMMTDYEARLGWKLSPALGDRSRITLSTMARLSCPNMPELHRGDNGRR